MFEWKIALKYLLPKRKSLSTALISLMSVFVISLVIWLVLVFLSVTSGIEQNWLKKLTSLHAPLRIAPTESYYSSYFYQIDSLASASNFTLKTIGEKAASGKSDPYSAASDMEPPHHWPQPEMGSDGEFIDPVKQALKELEGLNLTFQDYEIGGALLKLGLHRAEDPGISYLSQMSYLLSLTEKNPGLKTLIAEPTLADLNSLLATDPDLFDHIIVEKTTLKKNHPVLVHCAQSTLEEKKSAFLLWDGTSFFLNGEKVEASIEGLEIKGNGFSGRAKPEQIQLLQARARLFYDNAPSTTPPWAYFVKNQCILPSWDSEVGILMPKFYRDSGAKIGDRGNLSYSTPTAVSTQEQRIPIRVAGFYDPGILPIGTRCLIVPQEISRSIYAASQTFSPDNTPTNGIFVWTEDPFTAKEAIEKRFEEAGISSYWKVSTYRDFEFSRDIMQQFQSDKTLFLLIAAIILIVACCNIISLLVLLVNDKKKEIAILQSMGASFASIAVIFGLCGILTGALACLIGSAAAILTLHHLQGLVSFLSALQGHAAFHPAFFGTTLPNQLSYEALLFVLIATPLLSLAAGLFPALQASRINPSTTLRSE